MIRDKGKDPSTLPSAASPQQTQRRKQSRGQLLGQDSGRPHPTPSPSLSTGGRREGKKLIQLSFLLKNVHKASLAVQRMSPPANPGDIGSIPGPGRSHVPQGN